MSVLEEMGACKTYTSREDLLTAYRSLGTVEELRELVEAKQKQNSCKHGKSDSLICDKNCASCGDYEAKEEQQK